MSIAFNFSVKYAFANFLVFILIDIVKHTAGGHRPHFFDVCKPEQCMEGSWIEEFKCTSDASQFEIREASRSMPSGHSQAAVQFAVFLIWYMQRRVTKKEITTFFLPIIHLILLSCASFVCATRIFDHAHHSRDVIAGALIGLVTAVYVVSLIRINLLSTKKDKDYTFSAYSCAITLELQIMFSNNQKLSRLLRADIEIDTENCHS